MGNRGSKPDKNDEAAKAKAIVEAEMRKSGVLVPPSFGVVEAHGSSCLSFRDQLPYLEPSLVDELRVRDASFQLLNNYVSSTGVWLRANVDSTTSVATSFPVATGRGRITATTNRRGDSITKFSAGTHQNPPAVLTSSLQIPLLPSTHLLGQIGTDGTGWIAAHFERTLFGDNAGAADDTDRTGKIDKSVRVTAGSWIVPANNPIPSAISKAILGRRTASDDDGRRQPEIGSSNTGSGNLSDYLKEINGYASLQALGATAAVQVRLPANNLEPTTKSYFSINLTEDRTKTPAAADAPSDGATGGSGSDAAAGGAVGPPLIVTLERDDSVPATAAISLSQVVTFDRYQFNPMEDRAPYVRNTAAWTVRMERSDSTDNRGSSSGDGGDDNGTTQFMVGGAWQINRGLAVKAVLRESQLTTAVLLKRWRQPRCAFSFLFRHDLASSAPSSSHSSNRVASIAPRFVGIGVEIETGRLDEGDVDYSDTTENAASKYLSNQDVPKTKTTLG